MGASFGPETPLLSYGPSAHANPGGRNERVWLGWPAWAFRVVAPEFQSRRLNALQKAVLSVLRASRLTATELGERLGIHRELAAFVVADLQGQQRVDEDGKVTQNGIELLEDEAVESAKLVPAWMFRDALRGQLLPFAAPALEYARTVSNESGFPMLDLGSTGSPWQQRVWRLRAPPEAFPETPAAAEILNAARRSQQSQRLWQQVGVHEDDDLDEPRVETVQLDRLTSIEPEPQPVYLVTYLYTPRGDDADGDWHVCEFFGRGHDRSLRQPVIDAARSDSKLAQQLDRRLFAFTQHRDLKGFQAAVRQRDQRAGRLLARVLTIDIENHAAVAKPVRELLDAYLEWHDARNGRNSRLHRNVLMECRRTLEALFANFDRSHPLAGVADRLSQEDKALNEMTLRGAAEELGLSSLPAPLVRVRRGQVRAVSEYSDNWRLRPLVAATLLRARGDATHPLALAAKSTPDILERVEHVAVHGGRAAHGKVRSTDGASAEQIVQDTLDIAGLLLRLPTQPLEEILTYG